jgi:hypothetical protein
MNMKCSQCDREAIGIMNNGQGPAVCVEHYAILQNTIHRNISVLRDIAQDHEDNIDMMFGLPPKPRRPAPVIHQGNNVFNQLKIDNSNIGVVNTGTIDSLNSTISYVQQAGSAELANQIKSFAEAVSASNELSEVLQKEILEQLSYLGTQIRTSHEQRNQGVIKTILKSIEPTVSTAAGLATLWATLGPTISKILIGQ